MGTWVQGCCIPLGAWEDQFGLWEAGVFLLSHECVLHAANVTLFMGVGLWASSSSGVSV